MVWKVVESKSQDARLRSRIVQRKLYIWVAGLLGLPGLALAVHVLWVNDSAPAIVTLRTWRHSGHSVSLASFVRAILVDAFLLPVICWFFAAVAHAGRIEIDMFSWLFVAAFYLALWWLGFEVHHAYLYQISNRTPEGIRLPTGAITDPLGVLAVAVASGFIFWKWKQEGKLSRHITS